MLAIAVNHQAHIVKARRVATGPSPKVPVHICHTAFGGMTRFAIGTKYQATDQAGVMRSSEPLRLWTFTIVRYVSQALSTILQTKNTTLAVCVYATNSMN